MNQSCHQDERSNHEEEPRGSSSITTERAGIDEHREVDQRWGHLDDPAEPSGQSNGREVNQQRGHFDETNSEEIHEPTPPAPNTPSGTNTDGRLIPTGISARRHATAHKTIIKVCPHIMRDTELVDEQPWKYFVNERKKKQSREKIATAAIHTDGSNYTANPLHGSFKQERRKFEEMPKIDLELHTGATSMPTTHNVPTKMTTTDLFNGSVYAPPRTACTINM